MSDSRWLFDLLYLRGRTPWDTEVTPPEVVEAIESGGLAPGRALDLGCGTGTNCVYFHRHGWHATGVDYSYLAIWRARRRARREGAQVLFYRADVTELQFLDRPFDYVLDIGCLHSVPRPRRRSYASEVARLSRPGTLYMLYSFLPSDRHPDRGVTQDEVKDLFGPSFGLERQEGSEDPNGPCSVWYWLRRRGRTTVMQE